MRSFLVFLACSSIAACSGGVSYLGDLPPDGGTGGPAADSGTLPDGAPIVADGGTDTPEGGASLCAASWAGTCQVAGTACDAPLRSYNGGGCVVGESCCAPRCFPNGCPKGMAPSPTTDAICVAPSVSCIVIPLGSSACASNGGTCEFDDGSGLTDPCTATGRPIGAHACPADHVCCMP